MKQFFKWSLVIICILTVSGIAWAKDTPVKAETELLKVTENVYSYADIKNASPQNSFGANAGIVIGKESVAVIDTLISAKEAKQLIKAIRNVTDKPVKYVINTHYHLDHSFGNSEFAKLGAVIISHENCKTNIEKTAKYDIKELTKQYGLTDEDMEGTEIVAPTLSFNDRMQIDLKNLKVELIYIAPSHSGGSILIYLPADKVLFAGDTLFTNFHPYMGESDIDGWIKTLDYIMSLDADKIIPGHGPISGKKDVADMKEYLIIFDKKAKELCAASDDIEHIAAEMKKSVPRKEQGEWLIKANIQVKYLKVKPVSNPQK